MTNAAVDCGQQWLGTKPPLELIRWQTKYAFAIPLQEYV
jgi:hypothetical protein